MNGRVLIVDDDRELCAWLGTGLAAHGFATDSRTDPTEALAVLREADVDVVVTDLNMRSMHGLDLCANVVQSRPDVPVLVITAFGSLETAIGAIRAGAYDFITKPFEIEGLVLAIERAVQHRQLRDEVKRLRRVVDDARGFGELLGTSPAMARVYDLISRVLQERPSVRLSAPPRMADYGQTGETVSRICGWKSYADVYREHRRTLADRGVDSSPVALALLEMMGSVTEFNGTVGQLATKLYNYRIDTDAWPRSARGVADAIRRAAPGLTSAGLVIEWDTQRKADGFHVRITKTINI